MQGCIPYFHHHVVQGAMFLIAIFAALIKIKTHTRQHGNRPVHEADHLGHFYLGRFFPEKIATTLSFLAVEYPRFFQFQQDIFQEFQRDLFLPGNLGNKYRPLVIFIHQVS